ncbi:MAG: SOS response-associated peptidase [Fidelibacterota bacterium]
MCGRKTITRDMQSIIEELAIDTWQDPENYFPNYNVAPTQPSPILVYKDKRIVTPMYWGLIPNWAKDDSLAAHMINARAETVLEKPSFRNLMHRHRCIVIADGYYEWEKTESGKTPFYIHHPENKLLPLAGLWDQWQSPDGHRRLTYTVITTAAQASLAPIHNRMPVIIPHDRVASWIDWKHHSAREALALLEPDPVDLRFYPVSTLVNNPRNNSPDCIRPTSA